MISGASKTNPIDVYVRWRPQLNLKLHRARSPGIPIYQTADCFLHCIFGPEHDNATVYNSIVAPAIPHVLQGGNYNFFAYGHSGSGETHTILGYNYDDSGELGLCLAAGRQLFEALHHLNERNSAQEDLGIGFSLFELRNKSAFDLLNRRTECHVREGPDGKVHIRGETEMLEGGKVRVCPIVKQTCWTYESFLHELTLAFAHRAVGSSSVHDQSSRTHVVLELEIVSQSLTNSRQAVIDRQSELVPVGKRAIDVSIEEQLKGLIPCPEGGWAPNPDYTINQERIDAAEAEKAEHEERVATAEELTNNILKSSVSPCLGAKMVFVDLAGAEYHQEKGAKLPLLKQIPQERQEGRQINTDLLALKEVMRAWSTNQSRIPFRSSTLTMVLREHFSSLERGRSAMVVTVSPAKEQYAATLNSLKYGSLVGVLSASK
ncbi:hypothetical protein E8E14_009747 [Neopestalotiopsis sp. 37M]|nr:hypothetical protein E8E14_009747 [Neopestalotiopsis sp. 37M]